MTDLPQIARSVIAARDRYGWSPEVDAEINKMREALDSAQAGQEISDERIDYIAELVVKGMPEGIQGFCKSWGWRQFARALLDDCRGHYRASEVAETAASEMDHRSSGPSGSDLIDKTAVSPASDEAGELTDARIDEIQREYMQGPCDARRFARMIERAARALSVPARAVGQEAPAGQTLTQRIREQQAEKPLPEPAVLGWITGDMCEPDTPIKGYTAAQVRQIVNAALAAQIIPALAASPTPGQAVQQEPDLNRVLTLADEHADESREDGVRCLDRGGLFAFAKDLLRIYAQQPGDKPAVGEGR